MQQWEVVYMLCDVGSQLIRRSPQAEAAGEDPSGYGRMENKLRSEQNPDNPTILKGGSKCYVLTIYEVFTLL